MHNSIALDLKATRRKAGLLQSDLAHLLNIDRSKVSLLESGKLWPNLAEITKLSLIYGKPVDTLIAGLRREAVDLLVAQLSTMPPAPPKGSETFNRLYTLSQLAIRLEAITNHENG